MRGFVASLLLTILIGSVFANAGSLDQQQNEQQFRPKRQPPGGLFEKDKNDPKYNQLAQESLKKYLATSGGVKDYATINILKVTEQVVGGYLTRIDFEASNPGDNNNKLTCHSKIYERAWENKKEIDVTCDVPSYRKRRQLVGGPLEQNANDPQYHELAKESFRKFVATSGGSQEDVTVKVLKVTTQVVAGSLTRIDFEAESARDTTNKITCHSEVWEQPWKNKKEFNVTCQPSNSRIRRQSVVGGEKEVNLNDPKFHQLAVESFQKYIATSGGAQNKVDIKVLKVTKQVVSGLKFKIDFIASDPQGENKITCHSEIWEQVWLNKREFLKVDCA